LREVEQGAFMALRNGCPRIGGFVRLATAALISASAFLLVGAPAEAHHYRHYHRFYPRIAHTAHYPRYVHRGRVHYVRQYARQTTAAIPASPAFSAIVVDANSGRTLYSAYEDGLRHPASITKVMTLYLLFEELDRGAMTLHTEIPISEHAAAQEPSKLGLRPGDTISVEDAIKAVVTRSANDVAVAIAEAVGQTEDNFADMMTRKARALGMSSTLYRNASGLPNDEQLTTARDLAILGRAMEDRFPRYFHYFSTAEFDYDGEVIGNHNHLLGRVDGVDGIKTGYTRASGFNLLTSVHRDGRSLIAVVMGGRTAAARDRMMENLIADHLAEASTARTATMIADASPNERTAEREEPPVRPHAAPAPVRVAARDADPPIAEGDNGAEDDEVPAPHGTATQTTAARPISMAYASTPAAAAPSPADLGWVKGPDGSPAPKERESARPAQASAPVTPPERRESPEIDRHLKPQTTPEQTTIVARAQAPGQGEDRDHDGAGAPGSWMIQIGATGDLAEANALLLRARERNRSILAAAKPVTEKVRKGEDTLYRARFAMLDSASAESACRSLKRNGFACFPARD
jgi:D-alanyl-D-alanine carboxypeptidase